MTKVEQMVYLGYLKGPRPCVVLPILPDVVIKQSKGIGRTIHWHTF